MHRNMPVDLVLVRHGQSEGNLAQKLARQGELDLWTSEFRDRHNSLYRLTDMGRMQARIAGEYIRQNISPLFDKYFTSEYVRAMETAAALELPHARWATEVYLRERDRGVLANKPHQERVKEHKEEFVRKERDAFYWQPSGGESIANLCLRVDRVLENFGENCSGLRVIVVCHGGVIKSFRALIERVRSTEYRSHDKIHNCQIVWYTRRDPKTGYISSKYNWVKSLCPWDLNLSRYTNDWREIKRHVYSNVELLRSIHQVAQLVNCPLDPNVTPTALIGLSYDNSDSSDSDCAISFRAPPLNVASRSLSTGKSVQQTTVAGLASTKGSPAAKAGPTAVMSPDQKPRKALLSKRKEATSGDHEEQEPLDPLDESMLVDDGNERRLRRGTKSKLSDGFVDSSDMRALDFRSKLERRPSSSSQNFEGLVDGKDSKDCAVRIENDHISSPKKFQSHHPAVQLLPLSQPPQSAVSKSTDTKEQQPAQQFVGHRQHQHPSSANVVNNQTRRDLSSGQQAHDLAQYQKIPAHGDRLISKPGVLQHSWLADFDLDSDANSIDDVLPECLSVRSGLTTATIPSQYATVDLHRQLAQQSENSKKSSAPPLNMRQEPSSEKQKHKRHESSNKSLLKVSSGTDIGQVSNTQQLLDLQGDSGGHPHRPQSLSKRKSHQGLLAQAETSQLLVNQAQRLPQSSNADLGQAHIMQNQHLPSGEKNASRGSVPPAASASLRSRRNSNSRPNVLTPLPENCSNSVYGADQVADMNAVEDFRQHVEHLEKCLSIDVDGNRESALQGSESPAHTRKATITTHGRRIQRVSESGPSGTKSPRHPHPSSSVSEHRLTGMQQQQHQLQQEQLLQQQHQKLQQQQLQQLYHLQQLQLQQQNQFLQQQQQHPQPYSAAAEDQLLDCMNVKGSIRGRWRPTTFEVESLERPRTDRSKSPTVEADDKLSMRQQQCQDHRSSKTRSNFVHEEGIPLKGIRVNERTQNPVEPPLHQKGLSSSVPENRVISNHGPKPSDAIGFNPPSRQNTSSRNIRQHGVSSSNAWEADTTQQWTELQQTRTHQNDGLKQSKDRDCRQVFNGQIKNVATGSVQPSELQPSESQFAYDARPIPPPADSTGWYDSRTSSDEPNVVHQKNDLRHDSQLGQDSACSEPYKDTEDVHAMLLRQQTRLTRGISNAKIQSRCQSDVDQTAQSHDQNLGLYEFVPETNQKPQFYMSQQLQSSRDQRMTDARKQNSDLYFDPLDVQSELYFSTHASQPASHILEYRAPPSARQTPINIPPLPVPYTSPPRIKSVLGSIDRQKVYNYNVAAERPVIQYNERETEPDVPPTELDECKDSNRLVEHVLPLQVLSTLQSQALSTLQSQAQSSRLPFNQAVQPQAAAASSISHNLVNSPNFPQCQRSDLQSSSLLSQTLSKTWSGFEQQDLAQRTAFPSTDAAVRQVQSELGPVIEKCSPSDEYRRNAEYATRKDAACIHQPQLRHTLRHSQSVSKKADDEVSLRSRSSLEAPDSARYDNQSDNVIAANLSVYSQYQKASIDSRKGDQRSKGKYTPGDYSASSSPSRSAKQQSANFRKIITTQQQQTPDAAVEIRERMKSCTTMPHSSNAFQTDQRTIDIMMTDEGVLHSNSDLIGKFPSHGDVDRMGPLLQIVRPLSNVSGQSHRRQTEMPLSTQCYNVSGQNLHRLAHSLDLEETVTSSLNNRDNCGLLSMADISQTTTTTTTTNTETNKVTGTTTKNNNWGQTASSSSSSNSSVVLCPPPSNSSSMERQTQKSLQQQQQQQQPIIIHSSSPIGGTTTTTGNVETPILGTSENMDSERRKPGSCCSGGSADDEQGAAEDDELNEDSDGECRSFLPRGIEFVSAGLPAEISQRGGDTWIRDQQQARSVESWQPLDNNLIEKSEQDDSGGRPPSPEDRGGHQLSQYKKMNSEIMIINNNNEDICCKRQKGKKKELLLHPRSFECIPPDDHRKKNGKRQSGDNNNNPDESSSRCIATAATYAIQVAKVVGIHPLNNNASADKIVKERAEEQQREKKIVLPLSETILLHHHLRQGSPTIHDRVEVLHQYQIEGETPVADVLSDLESKEKKNDDKNMIGMMLTDNNNNNEPETTTETMTDVSDQKKKKLIDEATSRPVEKKSKKKKRKTASSNDVLSSLSSSNNQNLGTLHLHNQPENTSPHSSFASLSRRSMVSQVSQVDECSSDGDPQPFSSNKPIKLPRPVVDKTDKNETI